MVKRTGPTNEYLKGVIRKLSKSNKPFITYLFMNNAKVLALFVNKQIEL